MKFPSFILAGLAISSLVAVNACKNKASENTAQSGQEVANSQLNNARIAYVDIDTLESKYKYIVEHKEKFEKEQVNIDAEMQKLQREIQGQYINLQKKVDERQISQDEYEKLGARIQQMEKNYEKKAQELSQKFLEKTNAFQKDYRDRIDAFLKEYNADNKFDYVLTYQKGGATLLYANTAFDITNKIVEGLNKKYVPGTTPPPITTTDTTKK